MAKCADLNLLMAFKPNTLLVCSNNSVYLYVCCKIKKTRGLYLLNFNMNPDRIGGYEAKPLSPNNLDSWMVLAGPKKTLST